MIPHIDSRNNCEFALATRVGPAYRSEAGAVLFSTRELVEMSGFTCAGSPSKVPGTSGFTPHGASRFTRGICRSGMEVVWNRGFQIGAREVSGVHKATKSNPEAGVGGPVKGHAAMVTSRIDCPHPVNNAMATKFETSPAAGGDPGG